MFLEIVLGINNIIFISIILGKLPKNKQAGARTFGFVTALIFRIALLFGINRMIGFSKPLFSILSYEISGKDLILGSGVMLLLGKNTSEIHYKIEVNNKEIKKFRVCLELYYI